MKDLLSANGREKNAWRDPRAPRLTQPQAKYRNWRGGSVHQLNLPTMRVFKPLGTRLSPLKEREREGVYAIPGWREYKVAKQHARYM